MKLLIKTQVIVQLLLITTCLCVDQSRDKLLARLRGVGFWIRNHKFVETDQRFQTKKNREATRYFMRTFPNPRLLQLEQTVGNACKRDVTSCVNEIYAKYRSTAWGRLANNDLEYFGQLKQRKESSSVLTERQIVYEPFESRLALFQYRATAMYWMCYHTLTEQFLLANFGKDHCGNSYVDVKVDFQTHSKLLIYSGYSQDYRTNDSIPFACAQWSFCPDVCCGKIAGIKHTTFYSIL